MKAINNFIVEHLEHSTFPINEKLKISSKSKFYSCQPKDKYELRKILEERLVKDENANLNDIDVSQITDMGFKGLKGDKGLFENLDPHNIDISEWNVSNVTDMSSMFNNCNNFDADLSKWDVFNVTNMAIMFNECKNFTGKGLEKWNVSKVTDMHTMFTGCINFNTDLSKWNVSNVRDMESMFCYCEKFIGKGLENWNVSNVTDMTYIFYKCNSLKNKPSWYK